MATPLAYAGVAPALIGGSAQRSLDQLCLHAIQCVPSAHAAIVTREIAKNRHVTVVVAGEIGDTCVSACPGSPVVDVLTAAEPYLVSEDAGGDPRWAEFAGEFERIGARSLLALRLSTEEDGALGSLTLFSRAGNVFDRTARGRLGAVVAQAAVALSAMYNREQAEHLRRALETNRDIAVAMGIVMAHRVISREEAFDVLRAASQHMHRKIADLALDVVNTGVLEFPPGSYTQWVRR